MLRGNPRTHEEDIYIGDKAMQFLWVIAHLHYILFK